MDETKQCPVCRADMRPLAGVFVLVRSAASLPFSRELRWMCDSPSCAPNRVTQAAS